MRTTALLFVFCCLHGCQTTNAVPDSGPGQVLRHEMFYGKWDVDGSRTNEVRGRSGIKTAGSSAAKDVFGDGWRFERNGVLWLDRTFGVEPGSWRLEEPDTLLIRLPGESADRRYSARFFEGYLYLRTETPADGLVFERDKFFGF